MKRILALITALLLLAGLTACNKDEEPDPISGQGSLSAPESGSESGSESQPQESQPESEPQSEDPSSAPATNPVQSGSWQLVLVNKYNKLDSELDIQLEEVGGYKVDARIAGPLREMLAAAKADGIQLTIISGYRTIERSGVLYENKIKEYMGYGYSRADAQVEAAKWVAPPGTSEHHTGLAVDIVSVGYYNKYSDLVEEFENDPEAIWLRENAPDYGFILRFPKDKTDITGINYEPWHFRYVGVEDARAITEAGLCLEEYLAN